MRWITRMAAAVLTVALASRAQAAAILLDDPFADLSHWTDLSLVPAWGGHTSPTSTFEVADDAGGGGAAGVVRLTSAGRAVAGDYSTHNGAHTFTCLDWRFPDPVTHAVSTVTIDFRMRWDVVGTDSGERGRFILTLTHDYPAGGLDTTFEAQPGSKVADFSDAWWARPAYQIRLRSSTTANGKSILMYGGGLDPLGEFEKRGDGTAPDPDWWLPGFNSAPGGGSPGVAKGHVFTDTGIASAAYHNYRYVVTPTQQEIWYDAEGNGFEADDRRAVQDLTADPANPGYFHYFPSFEGLRLFFYNSGRTAYLDSLRVTVDTIPEPGAGAVLLLGAILVVRRRGR